MHYIQLTYIEQFCVIATMSPHMSYRIDFQSTIVMFLLVGNSNTYPKIYHI